MGIKGFNQSGDTFRNKFARAATGDSTGLDAVTPAIQPTPSGIDATGGTIMEWYDPTPDTYYRVHIFEASGDFEVRSLATADGIPNNVEFLLIAGGGGGGGSGGGGGGGAGGVLHHPAFPVSVATFPVVIGAGANIGTPDNNGQAGGDTIWNGYTAGGGGGGRRNDPTTNTAGRASTVPSGSAVGSGGGGGCGNGSETGAPGGSPGGYAGGNGNDPSLGSGGGGGSGGAGGNAPSNEGGIGRQLPTTFRDPASTVGYPGPSGTYWVAGGGGGASDGPAPTAGGGGGAASAGVPQYAGAGYGAYYPNPGTRAGSASANTGSGGGGSGSPASTLPGSSGNGGSGLVLIAYDT